MEMRKAFRLDRVSALKLQAFVAMIAALMTPLTATAQFNPLEAIIGGALNAARAQQIADEWQRISPQQQSCFNVMLQRNGTNIPNLQRQGVGPNDPRMTHVRYVCDQLANRSMRRNFQCSLRNQTGRTISSWCDEAYASANSNGTQDSLTVEQAIIEVANGRNVQIGEFEREDARLRREQMAQQGIFEPQVPSPIWGCDKATRPTPISICNSYELTVLDNQYGDYANRAKPFDKKKEAANKIAQIDKRTAACNGNQNCIKSGLVDGIDYLARFLNSQGVQVVGYTEAAEARQREAENRLAQEAERQKLARREAERISAQRREEEQRRLELARLQTERAKAEAEARRHEVEVQRQKAEAVAKAAREKAEADKLAQKKAWMAAVDQLALEPSKGRVQKCETGAYFSARIKTAATMSERASIRSQVPVECRCAIASAEANADEIVGLMKLFDQMFESGEVPPPIREALDTALKSCGDNVSAEVVNAWIAK